MSGVNELAIEVMRDYVKRNFVDDGMCAQFAIHDSETEYAPAQSSLSYYAYHAPDFGRWFMGR